MALPMPSRKQITLTSFRIDEVLRQCKSKKENPMSFNAFVANSLTKESRR